MRDRLLLPSAGHLGHCMELSTCYPLDASWLTTECLNGAVQWTTSALYNGTFADAASTAISGVPLLLAAAGCSTNLFFCCCGVLFLSPKPVYSMSSNYDMFSMSPTSCPLGMTRSVSANSTALKYRRRHVLMFRQRQITANARMRMLRQCIRAGLRLRPLGVVGRDADGFCLSLTEGPVS